MKKLFSAEVMVLVLLVAVHLIVFAMGVGGPDGWSYLANTKSLVLDGDVDLTNNRLDAIGYRTRIEDTPATHFTSDDEEFESYEAPRTIIAYEKIVTPAGQTRFATHEPIGTSLMHAPFYWVGTKFSDWGYLTNANIGLLAGVSLGREPYDTLTPVELLEVISVVAANNFYTILTVVILYMIFLNLGYSSKRSVGIALILFAASAIHWYGATGLSHAPSTFVMALIFYAMVKMAAAEEAAPAKRLLARTFVLGLLIGLASVVRYANIVFAVAGIFYLFCFRQNMKGFLVRTVAFALGVLAVAWITPYYWHAAYGQWSNPVTAGRFALNLKNVWLCWFGDTHGLFVFSPLLLLGLVGFAEIFAFRGSFRTAHRLSIFGLAGFLLLYLTYGSYDEWSGGGYGARFFVAMMVPLGIGVAQFLGEEHQRVVRWFLATLAAAFSYCIFLVTRSGAVPVELSANIRTYWRMLKRPGYVYNMLGKSSYTLQFLVDRLDVLVFGLTVFFILLLIALLRLQRRDLEEELARKQKQLAELWAKSSRRRFV